MNVSPIECLQLMINALMNSMERKQAAFTCAITAQQRNALREGSIVLGRANNIHS